MDPIALANQILTNIKGHNHEKAAVDFRTLLAQDAMMGDKWGDLARMALSIGEKTIAVDCANRFFNVKPGRERIMPVAGIYAEAGKLKDAAEFVEKRMGNTRDFSSAHFLGTIYGQLGQQKRAAQELTTALKIHAPSGITWLTLSAQLDFKEHLELLQQLRSVCDAAPDKDWQNKARLCFALAKGLADNKDKEASLSYYKQGNNLFETHMRHNSLQPVVDNIKAAMDKNKLLSLPRPRIHTDRPIFIAGLPRSGTTLLEQIISSHSAVCGGGEVNAMSLALNGVGEKSVFKLLENPDKNHQVEYFDLVLNRYLHLTEEQFGYEGRVVDKTLSNNRYLGLIAAIFPKSPMIIIRRKPEDVAWSCYRACFNDNSNWTWSAKRIADYIRAEERLFDHWLEVMPSRILEVHYEDIIEDFDGEILRVMNFLGLAFEPRQREFYNNQSSVTTSSVAQVRAPIDADAVNRSQDANEFVNEFLSYYNQQ